MSAKRNQPVFHPHKTRPLKSTASYDRISKIRNRRIPYGSRITATRLRKIQLISRRRTHCKFPFFILW